MYNIKALKRLMLFFGFVFLFVAAYIAFFFGDFSDNILPYAKYLVPTAHLVCCLLTLLLVFFPDINFLQIVILFIEATFTLLTTFEFLGLLLYTSILILGYCYGYFKTHQKLKISLLVLYWFAILFGIFPSNKIMFFIVFAASFYMIFFYLFVLYCLELKLSTYIPIEAKHNSSLPKAGEVLDLSKLDISDRDRQILLCLRDGMSYQEISEKIYYSVSTVKKDVLALCEFFKVKNVSELKILLFQYKITNPQTDSD